MKPPERYRRRCPLASLSADVRRTPLSPSRFLSVSASVSLSSPLPGFCPLVFRLRLAAAVAAGAETCTSVTVSGGEFPGVYEQGTGSSEGASFVSTDEPTQVLQAVTFGK